MHLIVNFRLDPTTYTYFKWLNSGPNVRQPAYRFLITLTERVLILNDRKLCYYQIKHHHTFLYSAPVSIRKIVKYVDLLRSLSLCCSIIEIRSSFLKG